MSGLCGWLAKAGNPDTAPALLDKMAVALPAGPAARLAGAARPDAGLALRGHPQESAWREDEGLWAAVIG